MTELPRPGRHRNDSPIAAAGATVPSDAWLAVVDPGPMAPTDPADDLQARGIYTDRPDVAAMIAAEDVPELAPGFHVVTVTRPGPPPKTLHTYRVRRVIQNPERCNTKQRSME